RGRPPAGSKTFPFTTLFRSRSSLNEGRDSRPGNGRRVVVDRHERVTGRSTRAGTRVPATEAGGVRTAILGLDDRSTRAGTRVPADRKSTRLNSSHVKMSYAV